MPNLRFNWKALVVCLLVGSAAPVWAARGVRVYDVAVDSSGPAAFGDAMRIALVRATGQRDADGDPALQSLVNDARRYAQVVRPASGGGTQISFDGAAVDRAVIAAGKSLWPRERPVVWVMVDGGAAAPAVDSKDLQAIADMRGLPVILQVGSSPGSVGSRDVALAAARRVGADYALLASAAGGGRYELRLWVPEALDSRLSTSSWSADLATGIHGVADVLAGSSIGLAVQPELETELSITGVTSLRDYADVSRSLTAMQGVKSLQLLEIGNGNAVFRLMVRGGDDTLQAALTSEGRFNPTGRDRGGRLSVAFQR